MIFLIDSRAASATRALFMFLRGFRHGMDYIFTPKHFGGRRIIADIALLSDPTSRRIKSLRGSVILRTSLGIAFIPLFYHE